MERCENIVRGALRPAEAYRTRGGWEIPCSGERELGLALKHARSVAPAPLGETLRALAAVGTAGEWLGESDLQAIARSTGSPIVFLRMAVARLNAWLAGLPEAFRVRELSATACTLDGTTYARGVPAALVLAGDAVTLGPWTVACAAIAGAPAVAKPSNVEPLSTYRFCRALLDRGIDAVSLVHLDSASDAGLVRRMIASLPQSVVFGEDATIAAVYGEHGLPPPHRAFPYWTGRSAAIVFDDADLPLAARVIVEGAMEDRGNRCISTKRALVPAKHARAFEALVASYADARRRGPVGDDATEVGRYPPSARAAAEAAAAEGTIVYDRDLLAVVCAPDAALLREELPYPILAIAYYDGDPVPLANRAVTGTPSGRALAVAVLTESERTFLDAAGRLAADKVLWNQPTTRMDYRTRHQGRFLHRELMREIAVVGPGGALG